MNLRDFQEAGFPIGFSLFKEETKKDGMVVLDSELDLSTTAPDGEYSYCDMDNFSKNMNGNIVVKNGKIVLYPTLSAIASNFDKDFLKNRVVQSLTYKELPEPNKACFFEITTAT